MQGYRDDLAYIHDAGYSDYALGAAPGLLKILTRCGVSGGLVVDLGCGSGRWARELNRGGYKVIGVDQSRAMIRLARRIAPKSEFKIASLWRAGLPRCDAITSIGECINYCSGGRASKHRRRRLFRRIFGALRPGGVFVCDFAGPERLPKKGTREHGSSGPDWSVKAMTTAHKPNVLRRHIIAVRRVGKKHRRSIEIHYQQLYTGRDICVELSRCGFLARAVRGYGKFRFPRGVAGVVAIKPS